MAKIQLGKAIAIGCGRALVVALSLVLAWICFAGTKLYEMPSEISGPFKIAWEHGWPRPFMTREAAYLDDKQVSWLTIREFHAAALANDVIIYLLLQMAILVFAQRRLVNKEGGGPFTFSVSEMLIGVTLICFCLGDTGRRLYQSHVETNVIAEQLGQKRHEVLLERRPPLWIKRLVGNEFEHSLPFFGIEGIQFSAHLKDEDVVDSELSRNLEKLSDVRILFVGGSTGMFKSQHFSDAVADRSLMTDQGLEEILKKRCFQKLSVLSISYSQVTGTSLSTLAKSKSLQRIEAESSELNDEGFAELAKIASVERVDASHSRVTKEILSQALKMPLLKYLRLQGTGIMQADCKELGSYGVDCVCDE